MLTKELQTLTDLLEKLPGVGKKIAEKYAYFLVRQRTDYVTSLSEALVKAKEATKQCTECFNYSESLLCSICSDPTRNKNMICIVTDVRDLQAMETMRSYKGVYHVLHGLIPQGLGVVPDTLRIKELFSVTLATRNVEEVIFALGATADGFNTTNYLVALLKPLVTKITEIAYGIGSGMTIDNSDSATVAASIHRRTTV